MSLLTTTIPNPPVYSSFVIDYINPANSLQNFIPLPDYFNKHTVWVGQFQYPESLFYTAFITSNNGFSPIITFSSALGNTDYQIPLWRPASVPSASGNLGVDNVGLFGGFSYSGKLRVTNGATHRDAPLIYSFFDNTMAFAPFTNNTYPGSVSGFYAPKSKGCVTVFGTYSSDTYTYANAGICMPIEFEFNANQISLSQNTINFTPPSGIYWAVAAVFIKSEQI